MTSLLRVRHVPRARSVPPTLLWISWERHRRSRELAAALGAELLEIVSGLGRLWKYPGLIWRSTLAIARRRPSVLFVQCPSVVLGALACSLRPLMGYRVVLDLHNECVEPRNYRGRLYVALLRWMWRLGHVAIVTNERLREVIEHQAAVVCVLPDRLPSLAAAPAAEGPGALVVFICTFAPDEPYRQVLEAARYLPDVRICVTGNYRNARDLPADLPGNVELCGFLPDADYDALLKRAHVLVDLTDLENCLVCGAYEAVALEKPLVTSDTLALRAYFSRGTVYANHTPAALAQSIEAALARKHDLAAEMRSLRIELGERWDRDFARLASVVNERA